MIWIAAITICGLSNAALSEQRNPPRLVVFGDSIAAGYGIDQNEAFPAQLQLLADSEAVAVVVVNAGLSGETTAGGARRIIWVLKQPVDILLIELGGNDALRGLDLKQTEENLRAIIQTARERHPQVKIILGGMKAPPNLGADFTARFETLYPRIAKDTGVTLIPFILEGVGGVAELNQADGIHPTAEGQKVIAETVWSFVKPML